MLVVLSLIVASVGCAKGYKIGVNGEVYNDYLKIKKWKGLEVEKVEPYPVTDEDVQLSIESDLQTLTKYVEIKDRGAQNGDQVTIDYVGKLDGVAFQGGTDSDVAFILGEGNFVPGFQEGVVGHKVGETFDVPLTFPENFGGELGGKAVVFTMTLKKVEQVVVPELTDETAKQLNPKAKNVEDYKKLMKADLEKSNQETADETMRSSLFSLLSEQWEVTEYPEEELKKHKEEAQEYCEAEFQSYLNYAASMSGMSVEEVKTSYGLTVDSFVSSMYGTTIEDMAKWQHALQMAIDLIAKVEKIIVEQKDIDAFLENQAAVAGYELEEYKKLLEEETEKEELDELLKKATFQEKVLDALWENCKIVEPKKTETETQTETGTETETTDTENTTE